MARYKLNYGYRHVYGKQMTNGTAPKSLKASQQKHFKILQKGAKNPFNNRSHHLDFTQGMKYCLA